MFVTIDPGNDLGWAIWNEDGLVECGLGDPRSSQSHKMSSIHDAWIEDQVIYPRSPVPPSDVLTLAKCAHRWAGRYDVLGAAVHFVEPSRWKGQVPKDISHARAWAKLSSKEREAVNRGCKGVAPKKRHNVLDAVAMGLWVVEHGLAKGYRL